MRIIHIEEFFHPYAGYQVNILSKFQARLGHEVFIICAKVDKLPRELTGQFGFEDIDQLDEAFYQEYGVRIIRIDSCAYISGRVIFSKSIFTVVDKITPDIVYVHGNDTFTGIRFITKAGSLHYPIVSDNHMVEIASVNRFRRVFRAFYKMTVTRKIIRHNIPVIRMFDDEYVNKNYAIPKELSPYIGFGTDTTLFKPDDCLRNEMRERFNIPKDGFVVIYAGKLDRAKGAELYAEAISDKMESSRPLTFVIIGNFVGEYGDRVYEKFKSSKNELVYLPTQKYLELHKFYNLADLAVYPRQCSMSFYDVQACGLPVLVEDNETNRERVSHGNGMTFKADQSEDLRIKLMEFMTMPRAEFERMKQNAVDYVRENYDYSLICEKYMEIIYDKIYSYSKIKKH